MRRKERESRARRILLVAFAFMIVLSGVVGSINVVFADAKSDLGNTINRINVRASALMLTACMKGASFSNWSRPEENDSSRLMTKQFWWGGIAGSDWFLGTDPELSSGLYTTYIAEVTGGSAGGFRCSADAKKIVNFAMETFGLDPSSSSDLMILICGKDNTGGLFTARANDSRSCSDAVAANAFQANTTEGIKRHVNQLGADVGVADAYTGIAKGDAALYYLAQETLLSNKSRCTEEFLNISSQKPSSGEFVEIVAGFGSGAEMGAYEIKYVTPKGTDGGKARTLASASGENEWGWDLFNQLNSLLGYSVSRPATCGDLLAYLAPGSAEVVAAQDQYKALVEETCRALDPNEGAVAVDPGDPSKGWTCNAEDYEAPDAPTNPVDSGSAHIDMTVCNSGAGGFSWLVCPAVNWIYQVVDELYRLVEDQLTITPSLFDDGITGLSTAWGTFRDLGNVVLVVLFVVIIVSQVTGFGIDNYGIKKMLPRLVVIAVLMNLSYIICVLLVDVSNITGTSINNFLKSLASGVGGGIGTGTGIALFGTIAALIIVALSNPVVLLPFAMTLLGGLLAILFMFLLLGVRQAAVAVLVVLAPLAFATNILPNTTGIFKKWMNIFKTLLLVFPICGLAMGGGAFGANLLMSLRGGSSSSFIFEIVALVLLFAPIFFIPKLTKGAFDGLGKIGGAITGLGGRLSGAVQGRVQNSSGYKRSQENLRNVRDTRLANRRGIGGAWTRRGQVEARARVLKREKEDVNIERGSSDNFMASERAKMANDQLDASVAAEYAIISQQTGANSLADEVNRGDRAAVLTRFNGATKEQKVAILEVLSDSAGGRNIMNHVIDNGIGNNNMSVNDRVELSKAVQRSKNFATLDKKGEDKADFFRNPTVANMAEAQAGVNVSAATLGSYDPATFQAISTAKNNAATTTAAAAAANPLDVDLQNAATAAARALQNFNQSVQNFMNDDSARSGSKISGDVATYAASQGITSAAAAQAATQAAQANRTQAQQNQIFQVQHQNYATNERATRGGTGNFTAPTGYRVVPAGQPRAGQYTDGRGNYYDPATNRFSR